MMSELTSIFSEPTELKIGEKIIKINTVTMGNIPKVTGVISKILNILPDIQNPKKQTAAILSFVTNDFASFTELLKVTTDLTEKEINDLNIGAGVQILARVIKENASFFAQHVAPAVQEATKDLGLNKSKS